MLVKLTNGILLLLAVYALRYSTAEVVISCRLSWKLPQSTDMPMHHKSSNEHSLINISTFIGKRPLNYNNIDLDST